LGVLCLIVGSFLLIQKNSPFGASFKFDPGIERAFHKLKKQRASEEITSTPMMAGGEEAQRRTLPDYVTLGAQTKTPSIAVSLVVVNNFELKLALIFMVQQSQFGGTPMEDPNLHLSIFLKVCDTLKIN